MGVFMFDGEICLYCQLDVFIENKETFKKFDVNGMKPLCRVLHVCSTERRGARRYAPLLHQYVNENKFGHLYRDHESEVVAVVNAYRSHYHFGLETENHWSIMQPYDSHVSHMSLFSLQCLLEFWPIWDVVTSASLNFISFSCCHRSLRGVKLSS